MYKSNKIELEELDWLLSQNTDMLQILLMNHIEMSRILVNEILETEVAQLQGGIAIYKIKNNLFVKTFCHDFQVVDENDVSN